MRQVEIQRMEFLRKQAKTPEGLTEKESERLRQLEAKEFAEKSKGGSENGRGQQNSGERSGSNTRANSGDGDNQDGGKVGRKGSSDERADGNESDTPPSRPSRKNDGVNRPGGNSGRGNRATSDESRGDDDGSRGDSGLHDGGDDGSETGRDGGSQSGSGAREEESGTQRVSNLKPKTNVTPKRKNTSKKKKSNELDADMIASLLTSGFGLIAKTTARPHWEITEEEAESVAEPMEYLLDNMTAKQKKAIEKYSNPIMLASAVAGIVVPRIMIDIAILNAQKKPKGVQTNVRSQSTIEASIDGDTQSDFKLSGVSENGGDTRSGQVASPVNDPIVAGLFSKGD